jgi:polar amino acid transport system substrate-binding protein
VAVENACAVGSLHFPGRACTTAIAYSGFFEFVEPLLLRRAQSQRRTCALDPDAISYRIDNGFDHFKVLTRTLKHGELIRTDSHAAAVELLQTGGADAKSSPRPVSMEESSTLPGSRVLDDGYAKIYFAALVPKGQTARLAYINEFVEDVKASGLVGRIIETTGLQGVRVAPAGKLSTQ